MTKPAELDCPTCGNRVQWTDAFPFRPFCCERCKLIDLGEWAAENHAIPGTPLFDPDLIDPDSIDPQELEQALKERSRAH